MKKNFFERMGLIESEEATPIPVVAQAAEHVACSIPVYDEVPCDLIQKIYEDNDLTNCDVSVYKVEDLMASLPKETPDKTRKIIITNLLATLKLGFDAINDDANERVNVLLAVKEQVIGKNNTSIANLKAEIQDMKAKIEEAEMLIEKTKAEINNVDTAIVMEVNRINDLINFITPEEVDVNAAK